MSRQLQKGCEEEEGESCNLADQSRENVSGLKDKMEDCMGTGGREAGSWAGKPGIITDGAGSRDLGFLR